ncbi:hypothetical protein ACFWQC_13615 [Nocardioides sp. NPDC058538]|uniref:hypothetical protein n=1 Tax=Nocardioides sp. NPDC058538 TaxID=3346542 RepID=UPI003647EED6
MTAPDVRPPKPPWTPLVDSGKGYLSVYLNDPLARWPVREITKPADNKSDPNIETGTYGLFSTCEPSMRKAVVANGAATVFFMTTRDKVRWLTGYYHIGWSAPGVRGASRGDYALAADVVRFVDPIDPKSLAKPARSDLVVRFRTQKPISAEVVSQLRAEIDSRDSRTDDYLAEVKRLEQFSLEHSGFAYPSWGRDTGFSWADAPTYLPSDDTSSTVDAPNSSPSGRWRCGDCHRVVENKALLKRCPACGELGTLAPDMDGD